MARDQHLPDPKALPLKLPPEVHADLAAWAAENYEPISVLARRILIEAVRDHTTTAAP